MTTSDNVTRDSVEASSNALAGFNAEAAAAAHPAPPRRPKKLVVALALVWSFEGLAVLMGGMGVLTLLVNLVVGPDAFVQPGPLAPVMREYTRKMHELSFPAVQLLLSLIEITISGLVIVHGIGTFRGKSSSRTALHQTIAVLAALIVLATAFRAFVQIRVLTVLQDYFGAILEQSGGGRPIPHEAVEIFETTMRVTAIVSFIFMLVVAAVRIGTLLWARSVVRSPSVSSYF